jgi:hypothetical protein
MGHMCIPQTVSSVCGLYVVFFILQNNDLKGIIKMLREDLVKTLLDEGYQLYEVIKYGPKGDMPEQKPGVYVVVTNGLNARTLVRASKNVRICINQLISTLKRQHLTCREFNAHASLSGYEVYYLETQDLRESLLKLMKVKTFLLEHNILAPFCYMSKDHSGWLK